MAGIVSKECLCAFVDTLGSFRAELCTTIDIAINLMTAAKAAFLLVNIENLEDKGRMIVAQAALDGMEVAIAPIKGPFAVLHNFTSAHADCDPVSTLASAINVTKDYILSPWEDWQYEIEQWSVAIAQREMEVKRIDRYIDVLEEIKIAIAECGGGEA